MCAVLANLNEDINTKMLNYQYRSKVYFLYSKLIISCLPQTNS